MRKLLFLFSAVLFLAGCGSDDYFEQSWQNGAIDSDIPKIIYATIANNQGETADAKTRTYVANDKDILWHNGDAISYFTGETHAQYVFNGEDGTENAIFEQVESLSNASVNGSYAVYPFSESNACDAFGQLSVVYPADQTYAQNSFGKGVNLMVAASAEANEENLYFRNACGYLVIKLYGEGKRIKSIKLSALDNVGIAGEARITTGSDGTPVVTMTDNATNEVTLDCSNGGQGIALGKNAEEATEFWFALPPIEMTSGMKITVTSVEDMVFEKQTNKAVKITRNAIQPMKAFEFTYQTYYTVAAGFKGPIDMSEAFVNAENEYVAIKSNKYNESLGKWVVEFDELPTEIYKLAFDNYDEDEGLSSFIIPGCITKIGESAFRCSKIQEITIPGNVTFIDKSAFLWCYDLSIVNIEYGEEELEIKYSSEDDKLRGPFTSSPLTHFNFNRNIIYDVSPDDDLEGLLNTLHQPVINVNIGPKVTKLDFSLRGSNIEELVIPGNVTEIASQVFNILNSGNETIKKLTIEDSDTGTPLKIYATKAVLDNASYGGFQNMYALETVYLGREIDYKYDNSDNEINQNAGLFHGCESLKTITFGNQVKTFSNYMFTDTGLEEINLPTTITDISEGAFYGSELASITIPGNIKSIGADAFYNCKKLKEVIIESSATPLTIGYSTYGSDERGPFYDSPLERINFNREFNYKDDEGQNFTPDGSDEGIFAVSTQATNGATVTLGTNVKTISKFMFSNLPVKEITIPSSVTLIDKGAFRDTKLTSITIPGTVNSIGVDAFYKCESLSSITFEQSATPLRIARGIDPDGTSDLSPFYYSPLKTITVNRELKYVDTDGSDFIPDYWDEGLFVHKYYKSIDEMSVTLGGSFKTISRYMFNRMPIKEITIPSSVTMIDNFAFDECTKLSRIIFSSGSAQLTIGFQPGDNERGPFFDSPLTYIELDRPLVLTAEYQEAQDSWDEGVFAYDYWDDDDLNLTTQVSLGGKVTSISKYMFSGVRMTGCWIPKEVNYIADKAFHDCEQLRSLSLGGTTPPALGDNVFGACDLFKTIYVPYKYQETYKNHVHWKEYKLEVSWWAGSESL